MQLFTLVAYALVIALYIRKQIQYKQMCAAEDLIRGSYPLSPTNEVQGDDIAAQIMSQLNEEENNITNTTINE